MRKLIILVLFVSLNLSLNACDFFNQIDMKKNNVTIDQSNMNEHQLPTEEKRAFALYQEFLDGDIKIEGIDINEISIPKGEPNRRSHTDYSIFDSNGDGLSDLHVKGGRYYLILSMQNGELILWKSLDPNYHALTNGDFMYYTVIGGEDIYVYHMFNYAGSEIYKLSFSKYINSLSVHSKEDEYSFDGIPVTKELWESLTERYLYTDENGVEQIRNEIEWTVLFDGNETYDIDASSLEK